MDLKLWLFGHMHPLALLKSSIRTDGFLVLDPRGIRRNSIDSCSLLSSSSRIASKLGFDE